MLRGRNRLRPWWIIGVVLILVAAAVVVGVNRWGNADKMAIRRFFAALQRADVAEAEHLVVDSVDVTVADQESSNEKTPLSLVRIESDGDRRYGVTYRLGDAEHAARVEAVGERGSVRLDGLVYTISFDGAVLGDRYDRGMRAWPGTFVREAPHFMAESGLVRADPVEVTVTQDNHAELDVSVTSVGRAKARRQVGFELMACGRSSAQLTVCPAGGGPGTDRSNFRVLEWQIADDSPEHYGGPITYSYWEREGQGQVAKIHETQAFMKIDPDGVELAR